MTDGGTKAPSQLGGALDVHRSRFQRYWRFLRALLGDGLRLYWRAVAFLIVSDLAAVALMVQGVGAALYYAKLLKDDLSFEQFGYSAPARTTPMLLFAFSAFVLITLLLYSFFRFASRRSRFTVWVNYSEYCTRRIFRGISDLTNTREVVPDLVSNSKLMDQLRKRANYCGRALSLIVVNVVPLFGFLGSMVVLLYLNPMLTLILMCVTLGGVFFLYRIGLEASHHSRVYDASASETGKEYGALLKAHRSALGYPRSAIRQEDECFNSGKSRTYFDSYLGRLLVLPKGNLVGDLVLSLALVALMAGISAQILVEGTGWERLAVYLVTLRYSLSVYRQLSRGSAALNRFYFLVVEYFDFVDAVEQPRPALDETTGFPRLSLSTTSMRLPDSLKSAEIGPGERVAVVSPWSLDRLNGVLGASFLLRKDEGALSRMLGSMRRVTASYDASDMYLGDALDVPSGVDWDLVAGWAKKLSLSDRLERHFPQGFQTKLSEREWEAVPVEVRVLLSHAMAVGSAWVWVDVKDLVSLSPEQISTVLGAYEDGVTALHYHDALSKVGSYGETLVAVLSDASSLGLGDLHWLESKRSEVEGVLGKEKRLSVEEDSAEEEYED